MTPMWFGGNLKPCCFYATMVGVVFNVKKETEELDIWYRT